MRTVSGNSSDICITVIIREWTCRSMFYRITVIVIQQKIPGGAPGRNHAAQGSKAGFWYSGASEDSEDKGTEQGICGGAGGEKAALSWIPESKRWSAGAAHRTEKRCISVWCGAEGRNAEAETAGTKSLRMKKLWDPDGRISCTVRVLLFSVSQKRAAITEWWSVRVWEYPNKPFPRQRECVPKARVGQGNIACQLVRCTIFSAKESCKLIDNSPWHD